MVSGSSSTSCLVHGAVAHAEHVGDATPEFEPVVHPVVERFRTPLVVAVVGGLFMVVHLRSESIQKRVSESIQTSQSPVFYAEGCGRDRGCGVSKGDDGHDRRAGRRFTCHRLERVQPSRPAECRPPSPHHGGRGSARVSGTRSPSGGCCAGERPARSDSCNHRCGYALTDPANLMLLDGVAEECEAEGLALVLVPATTPTEDFVDVLASAAIDGVVAHCDSLDEARRAIVRSRQLPLVVLDGEADTDARSIGIDDAGGARLAAEHVIALGHRRVAVMALGRSDGSIASLVARAAFRLHLGARTRRPRSARRCRDRRLRASVRRGRRERASRATRPADGDLGDVRRAGRRRPRRGTQPRHPGSDGVVGRRLRRHDHRVRGRPSAHDRPPGPRRQGTGSRRDAARSRRPARHLRLPVEIVVRGSTAPPPHDDATEQPRTSNTAKSTKLP